MSTACLWSNPKEFAIGAPALNETKVLDRRPHNLELELVERCRAADPAAWEELVRLHSPRVYNLCLRFTGRAENAEDLTQEVFVRLYRNLASYRPEAGSFAAWLTALTRNLLVDYYRRSRNDRRTGELPPELADAAGGDQAGPSPLASRNPPGRSADRLVWEREVQEQVQQALVQLSPELREVVILRDLQDMDYSDIAAALRLPLGTVKSRINRGRLELARRLRPRLASGPAALPKRPREPEARPRKPEASS